MKLNIALCDDDPQHLHYTEALLRQLLSDRGHSYELTAFTDPRRLLNAVESGDYVPALAVLDIDMGGIDGIALAKRLNALLSACRIIFLSGYSDFVSDVYEAEHAFFVLKDKAEQYMGKALDKALSAPEQDGNMLSLRFHGSSVAVRTEELIYVESAHRKLTLHTKERDYELSEKLAELESKLPEADFVRCHQSFLVNLRFVAGMDSKELLLTSGERLPVSRAHLKETRTRFLDRLSVKL